MSLPGVEGNKGPGAIGALLGNNNLEEGHKTSFNNSIHDIKYERKIDLSSVSAFAAAQGYNGNCVRQ